MYQLINNPINFYVYANLNDSNVNILYGSTGGLTLPDRDYYFEEDKENIRALYEEYGEWLDTYLGTEGSEEEYTTAILADGLTEY